MPPRPCCTSRTVTRKPLAHRRTQAHPAPSLTEGTTPECHHAADSSSEANWIAGRLKRILTGGDPGRIVILTHACQPYGDWLSPWTTHPDAAIASVTRIEALGFAGISPEEETAILDFVSSSPTYALDDEVIGQAINDCITKGPPLPSAT